MEFRVVRTTTIITPYMDENGEFIAEAPDFLGCVGRGATSDEALAALKDCLESLSVSPADGDDIRDA